MLTSNQVNFNVLAPSQCDSHDANNNAQNIVVLTYPRPRPSRDYCDASHTSVPQHAVPNRRPTAAQPQPFLPSHTQPSHIFPPPAAPRRQPSPSAPALPRRSRLPGGNGLVGDDCGVHGGGFLVLLLHPSRAPSRQTFPGGWIPQQLYPGDNEPTEED
jgi:hypothetical protein